MQATLYNLLSRRNKGRTLGLENSSSNVLNELNQLNCCNALPVGDLYDLNHFIHLHREYKSVCQSNLTFIHAFKLILPTLRQMSRPVGKRAFPDIQPCYCCTVLHIVQVFDAILSALFTGDCTQFMLKGQRAIRIK